MGRFYRCATDVPHGCLSHPSTDQHICRASFRTCQPANWLAQPLAGTLPLNIIMTTISRTRMTTSRPLEELLSGELNTSRHSRLLLKRSRLVKTFVGLRFQNLYQDGMTSSAGRCKFCHLDFKPGLVIKQSHICLV